ncbi:Uu.00g127280.m01.CDS01 [Anthostomella pinea]|uniref:Uu.00g127280.m01.CDS01 n=1 Tax=Anthostomella pinea TaxID=933095 RepID=A0AAI8VJ74_9PEZI|nr:Uu.00g127280.m01.CDS01 [Anthostomella pinea]
MAPTVHLVRHAEGYHNLCKENQQLRDPDLTPLGEQQCDDLRTVFPFHDKVTHLTASPIRRTLWTCLHAFEPAVRKGIKVLALPSAQEVSALPCDTGSDRDKLMAEFEPLVELALCDDAWNVKTPGSTYHPNLANLEARAKKTRRWLRELATEAGDDGHLVLVTHGGILHFITEVFDAPNKGENARTGWANAEYRSYHFVDESKQDTNATMKETEESQRRRHAIPMTETVKMEVKTAWVASLKMMLQKEADEAAHAAAAAAQNAAPQNGAKRVDGS